MKVAHTNHHSDVTILEIIIDLIHFKDNVVGDVGLLREGGVGRMRRGRAVRLIDTIGKATNRR